MQTWNGVEFSPYNANMKLLFMVLFDNLEKYLIELDLVKLLKLNLLRSPPAAAWSREWESLAFMHVRAS